jgi:hypothetical protein
VTRSFKSKEAGQRWVVEQERLVELGRDMMEVSAITSHKTLDMLKRYTQRAEQIALKMERMALQSADNAPLEVQLAAVLKELRLLRQM